jgi:WD40 repeat protein
MSKRTSEFEDASPQKRAKPSSGQEETALSTTVHSLNNQLTFLPSHKRKVKSHLAAPEITLSGHDGAIYSICFDPSGNHLCSSSMDRQIRK